MSKNDSLLDTCRLVQPSDGGCAWCGNALTGRRRKWCSEKCANTFWKNHWWTLARRAAKVRDKYRCRLCGDAPPKRPNRRLLPSENSFRSAMRLWRAGRKKTRLEVNHREPCLGQHGNISCAHHLDNLETLCAACHRAHTAAIPRARAEASRPL
ncbi:MAG: HNH endonuclease [Candidatus Eremiobacteraeota bacterium]|nr:HNH endonuclease [Candidatus Eremiobacteraeota bacterium]